MSSDWKTELRICKRKGCGKNFKPATYRQSFCVKSCQLKSIAADFPEQACGIQHCLTVFKPKHRNHKYCSDDCLQYARRPINTAATLARQKLNRKGTYMTDEQFREKARAGNPLKCQQSACAPNCRIRGMENLGCVA